MRNLPSVFLVGGSVSLFVWAVIEVMNYINHNRIIFDPQVGLIWLYAIVIISPLAVAFLAYVFGDHPPQ